MFLLTSLYLSDPSKTFTAINFLRCVIVAWDDTLRNFFFNDFKCDATHSNPMFTYLVIMYQMISVKIKNNEVITCSSALW